MLTLQYQENHAIETKQENPDCDAYHKGKRLFVIIIIVVAVAQVIGTWIHEYKRASIELGEGLVFYSSIDNRGMFLGILLRLGLLTALSYFSSRGQRCAKWLLAALCLPWLYLIIKDLLSKVISENVFIMALIALIYGVAAVVILFSKKIKAYIDEEKRQHYRPRKTEQRST